MEWEAPNTHLSRTVQMSRVEWVRGRLIREISVNVNNAGQNAYYAADDLKVGSIINIYGKEFEVVDIDARSEKLLNGVHLCMCVRLFIGGSCITQIQPKPFLFI